MKTTTAHRPLALAALVFCTLFPRAAAGQHFPTEDQLAFMLRYIVEDGETPGIVLGALEADGTQKIVAWGKSGPDAAIGPGSRFEIGDLTMTFTGTLLAEMAGRGEVSVDDPVSKYLPADVTVPSADGRQITLDDLARHVSGLPPGPADLSQIRSTQDLYDAVSQATLSIVPGNGRLYSPLGYALLGVALSRAAGMPFAELLRERVLAPLGMEQTGYGLEGATLQEPVRGYDRGAPMPPDTVAAAVRGATGLRSTAADLLRFVKANLGPPENALEQAMQVARKVRNPDTYGEGYGYSWRWHILRKSADDPLLVEHGGHTPGFTSMIYFDPARGIGTVVLTNTGSFTDYIGRNLLYYGPPPEQITLKVDTAVARRYVGSYKGEVRGMYRATVLRPDMFIRLEPEGYLTYQVRGGVRTPLYVASDSSFHTLRGPRAVAFSEQGGRMRMVVRVDDREPSLQGQPSVRWKESEKTPPPAVVAGNAASGATSGRWLWIVGGVIAVAVLILVVRGLRRRAT